MTVPSLRRWSVAIAMIVALATLSFGRSGPAGSATPAAGGAEAVTVATNGPGWHLTDAVIPVRAGLEALSAYERGLRVKLGLLAAAVLAVGVAVFVARPTAARRRAGVPRLPALQARCRPRRAPPALLLR